jgi:hypothetical protein
MTHRKMPELIELLKDADTIAKSMRRLNANGYIDEHGKPHGVWKSYHYASGKRQGHTREQLLAYELVFNHGKPVGKQRHWTTDGDGMMGAPDGKKLREWATYSDNATGVLHGSWGVAWGDGSVYYRGEFDNGTKHGAWKYSHPGPLFMKVDLITYKRGERHGPYVDYDLRQATFMQDAPNFCKTRGTFKRGKRDGWWSWYTVTGRTSRRCTYVDGKLDGESIWLYSDGQRKEYALYDKGKRVPGSTKKNARTKPNPIIHKGRIIPNMLR